MSPCGDNSCPSQPFPPCPAAPAPPLALFWRWMSSREIRAAINSAGSAAGPASDGEKELEGAGMSSPSHSPADFRDKPRVPMDPKGQGGTLGCASLPECEMSSASSTTSSHFQGMKRHFPGFFYHSQLKIPVPCQDPAAPDSPHGWWLDLKDKIPSLTGPSGLLCCPQHGGTPGHGGFRVPCPAWGTRDGRRDKQVALGGPTLCSVPTLSPLSLCPHTVPGDPTGCGTVPIPWESPGRAGIPLQPH